MEEFNEELLNEKLKEIPIFKKSQHEENKKIYVRMPDPLNLQYRKEISFKKDEYTMKYLNKFTDDMKFRFKTKIKEMTEEELILFAVQFLGNDKDYQYYYIYEKEKVIGEIYAYSNHPKNNYFFNIYISEEYRKIENYIDAILDFEWNMFSIFTNAKNLYIYTEDLNLEEALKKSEFILETEYASGEKRYICKEYMTEGVSIEEPTIEHEEKFRRFLKNDYNINYKIFNYEKWLKKVKKNREKRKEYFLMYYNDDLKDTEIVGVGHVLKNWKKKNCIEFKIEKRREQTDFGKYFLEMLFEKLDDNAEYIKLTCPKRNHIKIKQYEEVFSGVLDNTYVKNGKMYFEMTLIEY